MELLTQCYVVVTNRRFWVVVLEKLRHWGTQALEPFNHRICLFGKCCGQVFLQQVLINELVFQLFEVSVFGR
jgi:hypothetical protein